MYGERALSSVEPPEERDPERSRIHQELLAIVIPKRTERAPPKDED